MKLRIRANTLRLRLMRAEVDQLLAAGETGEAMPALGGVLATVCPADKKILHGMRDAMMLPCVER